MRYFLKQYIAIVTVFVEMLSNVISPQSLVDSQKRYRLLYIKRFPAICMLPPLVQVVQLLNTLRLILKCLQVRIPSILVLSNFFRRAVQRAAHPCP